MSRDIAELKHILNLDDRELPNLAEALTHRSFAVEHGLHFDNQRLEFLGDAVLEIILTEFLYFRYPEYAEGAMTKIRASLVREKTLATLAGSISLGDFLMLGKGEEDSGGASRPSTLADLFEAVLGALYLDEGFPFAKKFVVDLMNRHYPKPHLLFESMNPKGQLQEYVQKRWNATPKYTVLHVSGPEHQPVYEVEATVGKHTALGRAASRKLAECAAARELFQYFQKDLDAEEKHEL